MSWETVNTGIRAASMVNTEQRRQRLEELQQHINGFELDKENNKYVENERGALAMAVQKEKLLQNLDYLKAQNDMMRAVLNEQSMTAATSALLMGDHATANHILQTNPTLKEDLKKHFGVVSVAPIDWEHDATLFEENGFIIDKDAFENPTVKAAFNSAFSKIIKSDGSIGIIGTEQLAKETNYLNYLPPKDRQAAIARFNKLKEIISGHITTPEELAAKQAKAAMQISEAKAKLAVDDYNVALAKIKKDDLMKFFEQNPNATLADYIASFKPTDAMKKKVAETKLAQENIKLEEEKLKLKAAQLKAQQEASKLTPLALAAKARTILDKPKPTLEDIEAAKQYEAENIKQKLIDPKALQDLRTQADFVNDFKQLEKEVDNVDTDAIESIKTDLKKIFGVSENKEKAAKELAKLRLDTKIGLTMSRFLKFMSGAAVSNEEYKRYVEMLKGGDWTDETALRQTINAFRTSLENATTRRVKSIYYDAPYTAYRIKQILGDSINLSPAQNIDTSSLQHSNSSNSNSRPPLSSFEEQL